MQEGAAVSQSNRIISYETTTMAEVHLDYKMRGRCEVDTQADTMLLKCNLQIARDNWETVHIRCKKSKKCNGVVKLASNIVSCAVTSFLFNQISLANTLQSNLKAESSVFYSQMLFKFKSVLFSQFPNGIYM